MKRFFAAVLCLVLLVGILPINAFAAGYPYISLDPDCWRMKIPKGEVRVFKFTIFPEYKEEIVHVKIYNEDGYLVGQADKQLHNYSIGMREYNVTLETSDWDYGTYTIEYYMSFYTYYSWHDCPTKHRETFTITKPCANQAHSYDGGKVTTEPTCEENGVKTYTCNSCGSVRTETIPQGAHVWDEGEVIAVAGCETKGRIRYTCTVCDETKEEETPVTGHSFDHGTVMKEATWNQNGQIRYTCSVCGKEKKTPLYCLDTDNCAGSSFTDLPDVTNWAHTGIDYVIENKLFNGTGSTTFSPDLTMTRGMLVTVLYRFVGEPAEGESIFTDVPAKAYYASAVAWAAKEGIVNGVGNNRFNPDGTITREQMATILFRFAMKYDYNTDLREDFSTFTDGNAVSGYARDALSWAVGMKLINGSNGKLMPQDGATRAQVAAILMRFIENCRPV